MFFNMSTGNTYTTRCKTDITHDKKAQFSVKNAVQKQ